jgi:hypothetical protein
VEHRHGVRHSSDLVVTLHGFKRAIEVATRKAIHRGHHLHERSRQSSTEQQRGSHHRRDGHADGPEHVAPHFGEIGLDGFEAFTRRLSYAVEVRPQPVIDLGQILRLLGQRALPGHERQEARLVGIDKLDDLGLRVRGQIRLLQLGQKFDGALFQLIAIFLVAAQHEILLMPAHHQHQNREPRLIEGLELACFRPYARRCAASPAGRRFRCNPSASAPRRHWRSGWCSC